VARNDEGGAVEFLLGRSSTTGWLTKSTGTLEQLVIDESVHGQSIGTELVERWKSWLIAEGVPLGFASTGPDAAGLYEQCGFPTLHRTLARVGSRMRPIQALYSAGGDADSVRELSVTATGRCSANDWSAAAATRAVIRPSSR
jgi:GNAT superfamily N-acetyltransferase